MKSERELPDAQPSQRRRHSAARDGSTTSDGSWLAWTAGGMVGIWIAVILISFLSPDMVSGSHQERLPVAAFSTWLWGLVATGAYLAAMGRLRGRTSREPIWVGLTTGTLVIWLVATMLSLTLPVFVTGSDPTRIPIASLVAPIAATLLTTLASGATSVLAKPPGE